MAKDTKKTTGAGTAEDPVRVAVVPAPADENGFVAGEALTPGQRAGLEPLDPEKDLEQAQDREHLTNLQTDFEAAEGLDAVSGGPSPGVTEQTPLTAKQQGAPASDMSGRPAVPGGVNLTDQEKALVPTLQRKLKDAKAEDKDKDAAKRGWRTPQELGIPGGVMRKFVEAGAPLETETVPNGHFFPETGTRYRLK